MHRMILAVFTVMLVMAGPSPAMSADPPTPPHITVDAEGKVTAIPDMATLAVEVETQAPTAAAAAHGNARQTDGVVNALKKVLGAEDKLRTLGYRLTPVRSYKDKTSPGEIKAYRAVNRLEVKIMDTARLGPVLDNALTTGASQVSGPFWSHSRIEELQRQAAVNALERARRLAEALAQTAGVKIKGVDKITTGISFITPRAAGEPHLMGKAVSPTPSTPLEVGEEEIKAQIHAVFLINP